MWQLDLLFWVEVMEFCSMIVITWQYVFVWNVCRLVFVLGHFVLCVLEVSLEVLDLSQVVGDDYRVVCDSCWVVCDDFHVVCCWLNCMIDFSCFVHGWCEVTRPSQLVLGDEFVCCLVHLNWYWEMHLCVVLSVSIGIRRRVWLLCLLL